jgi:hypothetical protein
VRGFTSIIHTLLADGTNVTINAAIHAIALLEVSYVGKETLVQLIIDCADPGTKKKSITGE